MGRTSLYILLHRAVSPLDTYSLYTITCPFSHTHLFELAKFPSQAALTAHSATRHVHHACLPHCSFIHITTQHKACFFCSPASLWNFIIFPSALDSFLLSFLAEHHIDLPDAIALGRAAASTVHCNLRLPLSSCSYF